MHQCVNLEAWHPVCERVYDCVGMGSGRNSGMCLGMNLGMVSMTPRVDPEALRGQSSGVKTAVSASGGSSWFKVQPVYLWRELCSEGHPVTCWLDNTVSDNMATQFLEQCSLN